MPGKFYITTPIYYANAEPHIGSAYTTIAADILARWHRMKGDATFFLTGTDEHGQKIQEAARASGMEPKEFVDSVSGKFREMLEMISASNDNFIRTTDEEHVKEVKDVLQRMFDGGFIYKGVYDAYYCVGCEQYLSKSELEDGKCPLHRKEPEIIKEECYMFRLSSFQEKLASLIESGEYRIIPETRRNEILSFIKEGLQDISISRKKSKVWWGIEMPFDSESTCYVWVDAFWNYVSGLKEKGAFDKFWPPDVQLMANDIIRVHATIWPAILLATGNSLPKCLFVHGYFTVNGQKMSKSLGNVVSPVQIVDKYGPDSLRYFLIRDIQFGQDGDFSEASLKERVNNELGANFGNLFFRVTSFIEKNFGEVPVPGDAGEAEKSLEKRMKDTVDNVSSLMDDMRLTEALKEIMALSSETNRYFQDKEPWKKIKTDENDAKTSVYYAVNALKTISILLYPFMPRTGERAIKLLDTELIVREIKPYILRAESPESIKFDASTVWAGAGKLSVDSGSKVFSDILVKKIE